VSNASRYYYHSLDDDGLLSGCIICPLTKQQDAIKHADDAEQITQLPTATMREWRPIIRNQGCSVRKTCGFYLLDESERLRCAGDASESLASAAKAVALLNTVDDDAAYRQAHLQYTMK
jgi:hypothetical protein